MAIGAGKYDDIATAARKAANARGVIMLVFEGDRGSGFSIQTLDLILVAGLPAILRDIAQTIEDDLRKGEL